MSGFNKDQVWLAVTGAVSTAPVGTPAPTDATTPLGPEWFNRGYVGEDGLTEENTVSRDEKRAWQRRTVLRRTVTEAGTTYTFRILQINRENIELIRGTTFNADGSITVDPGVEYESLSWVLDIEDGVRGIRKYLPSAQLSEVASITYNNDELIGWDVTVSADEFDFSDGTRGTFREWYKGLEDVEDEGDDF